jgi:PPOX class probable FMN-dependent enzyme
LGSATTGKKMTITKDISTINTLAELREIHGETPAGVKAKVQSALDEHAKNFIARSPFLILATNNEVGSAASPRGDTPGFVEVLDDTTLLIPERPGNRLADSLTNIVSNPNAGLIFLIPGMNETLRINGKALITNDKKLLAKVAHKGKQPTLAIIMDIEQVYFHCAKAFIRSDLWNAELHMPRKDFPTLGKILLDQIKGKKDVTTEEVSALDTNLDADAENNLYH